MKEDNKESTLFSAQHRTEKNYRFIKKIFIAADQFPANRGSLMASLQVGEVLHLVREARNPRDAKAIRVDTLFSQKLGYVPQQETSDLADKLDEGTNFFAIISSIQRSKYEIAVDIYERVHFPFPDFTSFTLDIRTFGGPAITCSILTRTRKLIYKKSNFGEPCQCVELKFFPDYWNTVLENIQNFNFLAWEEYYENPGVLDGTDWDITIRRRNEKNIKIHGLNAYPEEWPLLEEFIYECLDLSELKGEGKFYTQTSPEPSRRKLFL